MTNDTSPPDRAKGKAKAIDTTDQQDNAEAHQPGLISRVADSAFGLARDTVGAANTDAAGTLSSNALLGSKAQPSGLSGTGASLSGETPHGARTGPTDASSAKSTGVTSAAFRSQQESTGVDQQFEQFSSGNATLGPSITEDRTLKSDWQARWNENGIAQNQPVEIDDGAEVRALLSDPTFNADSGAFDIQAATEMEEQSMDDLFPANFSTEEQQVADFMKKDLPAPPAHKPVPVDHPLNLRPLTEEEMEGLMRDLSLMEESSSGVELERPLHSSIADWEGVLNSYSDEVWGELAAAVRKSKEELEQAKAGETKLDKSAVARLRMIMGHLQQRQTVR